MLWHYQSEASTKRDCGVIFGAAVWRDDIPSHALRDRVVTGAKLYNEQRISCIVLSGGASTFGAHEVDVMKKVLLEKKIPEKAFIEDRNGVDTESTLSNLDPKKSYVLISNDFHLARIKHLAHRENLIHFDLHASQYLSGRYPKEPYFFFREVIANIYYFFHLDKINAPKKIPPALEDKFPL